MEEDMKMEEKLHLMTLEGVEAYLNLAISLLDSKETNRKTVKQLLEFLRQGIKEALQVLQPSCTTIEKQEDLESVEHSIHSLQNRTTRLEELVIGDNK